MSTHQTADLQVIVPTTVERVQFHDGQLVDADALTAAAMFPVSLLQLVLRSFLGCGIVCGLEVERPDVKRPVVRIKPGVMVDYHGMPVELCREAVLDLTPDPCACEMEKRTLAIVMRRATSEDAPRRPCGCGCGESESAHDDCNRVRDQVLIKAVDLQRLDPVRDHVCWTAPEDSGGSEDSGKSGDATARVNGDAEAGDGKDEQDEQDECACLVACAGRCCAEHSWVLLASVTISPVQEGEGDSGYTLGELDLSGRKYVKPIECCRSHHQTKPEQEATGVKAKATSVSSAPSDSTSEA
ncbi:hypothetical protein [Kribbella sp. VKM Ac-2568]|uniref:hypothetical protein n=1 Tax=Kribbella sp. VKM Ac-2568 TaxID=2512219 RepID=UPI001053830C|nr:hypothetical protein [Kribbella sp. VKM Ac-2568]TCM35974.1 hypothetical protein EV648_12322 [Kribbella sp. VKM Ac-2568]